MSTPSVTTQTSSRRAVLTAALGAGAVGVATTIVRAPAASADDGFPVLLGEDNSSSSTTTVTMSSGVTDPVLRLVSTDGTALRAVSTNFEGVRAQSTVNTAVSATSQSGFGVYASTDSEIAMYGTSNTAVGVCGTSAGAAGVLGSSNLTSTAGTAGMAQGGGTGVLGCSGLVDLPAAPARTGVFGYAAQSTGRGVRGYATSGVAGYFSTAGPRSGLALQAVGRVRLDKSAGLASIAAGARTVTVTPGIDLVPASAVVATLQGDAGGTTTVQRVSVDTSTNRFTIHLTARSTRSVKVAWHVFG
jgi:hypothetical protein